MIVWLNQGGHFSLASTVQTGLGTVIVNDVCVGDIDADGDIDLFVVPDFMTPPRLYRNNGHASFSQMEVTSYPTGLATNTDNHVGCVLGDLTGDGSLDLAHLSLPMMQGSAPPTLGIWRQASAVPMPVQVRAPTTDMLSSRYFTAEFGDADGDGDADLVITTLSESAGASGGSEFYINDGAGVSHWQRHLCAHAWPLAD
jgi:hypothetical protein